MKYNKKEIMTRAHEIAKTLEGNYSARMSIALKQAWSEFKMEKQTLTEQFEKFLGFTFNHKNDRLEMTTSITVKYSDYKRNYYFDEVKKGNYDATNKTIDLTITLVCKNWGTETVEEMLNRRNTAFDRTERLVIASNFNNYEEIKAAIANSTK